MQRVPELKVADVTIRRSLLLEKLAAGSQRAATIEQWKNHVCNMAGFAKEERDLVCRGILAAGGDMSQRFKVERILELGYTELAKYVPVVSSFTMSGFRPTVGVKAVPGDLPKNVEARARRFVDAASVCYKHPALGYWLVKTGYEDLATKAPNWIVLDNKGRLLTDPENNRSWFESDVKALDVMHVSIDGRFKSYGGERAYLNFEQYTLPAGSDHREWLVQVPNWPAFLDSEHFHVDSLIAHVRTTQRRTVLGEQILFIEEIQSDAHAEIRRTNALIESKPNCKMKPRPFPPFKNTWHEIGIKVALSLAAKQGFSKVGFINARAQADRWGELEGLRTLYDRSIPKSLEAVSKKFDCGLAWDGVITRQRNVEIRRARDGDWVVRGRRSDDVSPRLKMKSVAGYYADQRSKVVSQRVRTITISAKLDAVLSSEGLPIFGW
ncbi:MAG: hypothetical protein ING75_03685 [Rhodocyclaceae bacterium]|nr:hypothetical protein [Rhodocyclaceae bacterium]